ncbi:MAG: hypothetical protein HRF40_07045 [Nitrososphaera sp.]|jgi:hypothetical protein
MKRKYLILILIIVVPTSIAIAGLLYSANTPAWLLIERSESNRTEVRSYAIVLTDEELANHSQLKEGLDLADMQFEKERRVALPSVVKVSNSEGNRIVSLLSGDESNLPPPFLPAPSMRFIVSNDGELYSVLIRFGYETPGIA